MEMCGRCGEKGMGVFLPCGFIRGEIQSCQEVARSDFSLVNLRGENRGNLSRQATPKTAVLGVYGGNGGPLGDALA
eukprot:8743067-Pyramimonas_sp.AAC.2